MLKLSFKTIKEYLTQIECIIQNDVNISIVVFNLSTQPTDS